MGDYRRPDDHHTGKLDTYRVAPNPLQELCGATSPMAFGPRPSQAVRVRRTHHSRQVGGLKIAFRGAVGQELIPGLWAMPRWRVAGLNRGHRAASESAAGNPVPLKPVAAIEPNVRKSLYALIQPQRLTGVRA